MPMEEEAKIRIGGIKFSEELVQVRVALKSPADSSIKQLLHLITEKHINIPFLCHSVVSKSPETIFCVERSEMTGIQQILDHSCIERSMSTSFSPLALSPSFPIKTNSKFSALFLIFLDVTDFQFTLSVLQFLPSPSILIFTF